ncbi:hypothetical protein F1559_002318 [Cyanidiococcus yangmingshanensis]|uniref:Elongator complex protein 1 n=1 Tax=Cyanidiococcus yangmingshanensis TaxID=2690220 RepID=A0A7J7IJS2_9RHOD|nr:hypothetical protein F1559_002318 [Cyanidiococcus yangmingshanensis]
MQNLSLEEVQTRSWTSQEPGDRLAGLSGFSWRLWQTPTTKRVVAVGVVPRQHRWVLCDYFIEKDDVNDREHGLPTDILEEQIQGFFWCQSLAQTIVAFRSGHLVAEQETVGLVPEGLAAVEASSSQDYVVLVTEQGDLILLDGELEVVGRSNLRATLFGSAGRSAADTPGAVQVAWRPDGAYFAVSYPSEDGLFRTDIYGAPSLQWVATAEPQPLVSPPVAVCSTTTQLGNVLTWQRRRGGVLAVATLDGSILFFEKNGFRHARMDMEQQLERGRLIWGLTWNAEDTLLAVGFTDISSDSPDAQHQVWVDIYAFRNYHWYLKYRIDAASRSVRASQTMWIQFDSADPLLLFWGRQAGDRNEPSLIMYRFQWTISVNAILDDTIAVIDGNQVLLTPLGRSLIPPPMSAFHATIPSRSKGEIIHHLIWEGKTLLTVSNTHQRYRFDGYGKVVATPAVEQAAHITADANTTTTVSAATPKLDDWLVSPVRSVSLPEGTLSLQVRTRVLQWRANGAQTDPERCVLATDCISFVVVPGELLAFWTTVSGSVLYSDLRIVSSAAELRRRCVESERIVDRGAVLLAALSDGLRLVLETPRGNLETITPRILVERKILRVIAAANEQGREPDLVALLRLARRHCIEPRDVVVSMGLDRFLHETTSFLGQFLARWRETGVAEALQQLLVSLNERDDLSDRLVPALVNEMERLDPERFLYAILTAHVTRRPQANLDAALQQLSERFSVDALRYVSTVARKSMDELYRAALGRYDLDLAEKIARAGRMDRAEYQAFLESLRQMEPVAMRRYEIDLFLSRPRAALQNLFLARRELGPQVDERIRRLVEHFHLAQEAYLELVKLDHEPLHTGLRHEIALLYAGELDRTGAHLEAAQLYALHGAYGQASAAYLASGRSAFSIAAHLQRAQATLQPEPHENFLRRLVDALCNQRRWEDAAQILAGPVLAKPEEALQLLFDAHHFRAALRLIASQNRVDWLHGQFRSALVLAVEERASEMRSNAAKFRERAARLHLVREHRRQLQLHTAAIDGNPDQFPDTDGDSELEALASDIASMSTFTFGTHSESSSDSSRTGISTDAPSITNGNQASGGPSRRAKTKTAKKKKKKKIKPGDPHEELYLVEYLRRLQPSAVLKDAVHEIMECLFLLGEYRHAKVLQQAGDELQRLVQDWTRTLDIPAPTTPNRDSSDAEHSTTWFASIAL